VLDALANSQAGVVTRQQLLGCGMTDAAIDAHVRGGRWQRVGRGMFATFTGPLPRQSALWAAVLAAGPGAMLSHESAAELNGLVEPACAAIHVTVPANRRSRAPSGVVVHRSRRAVSKRHPVRLPPQTRIEETVIDLTQSADTLDRAIGWVLRAVGGRLTTVQRLARSLRQRGKVRWRLELLAALHDGAAGCHSLLERRYLHRVERAHGLPRATRQRRRGRWYDDVTYPGYGVTVELDGKAAHPTASRFRDHRRDNAAVVSGQRVLRYGFDDVTRRPCAVAREVATLLAAAGWRGPSRTCGRPNSLCGNFSRPEPRKVSTKASGGPRRRPVPRTRG
jgi:very-short-patch-repair endonuclease